MPHLRLRGPLKQRAGDRADHELDGATVGELLRSLEREHPAVTGWIVDERGRLRRHINVFVNGELAADSTAVAAGDRVEVIPAISGGSTCPSLSSGPKRACSCSKARPVGRSR